MTYRRKPLASALACALTAAAFAWSAPAHADGAGAFIGGVVTYKVLNNMQRRTEAEEARAYRSQPAPPVQQHSAPPPAAAPTAEQKLQQLDRLAAGGYISPEEYKQRRKAILDSM